LGYTGVVEMKDIFEELDKESFVDKVYFDEKIQGDDDMDDWDFEKMDEVDDWDYIHFFERDEAK
jgi:hypothetical protein